MGKYFVVPPLTTLLAALFYQSPLVFLIPVGIALLVGIMVGFRK